MSIHLGALGACLRLDQATPQRAAAIEAAGYGTVWLAGSPPADLAVAGQLLEATERLAVGTGIVNMWTDDAKTVAASYHRITAAHPDRFLLGVGVGHREAVPAYSSPYDTVRAYLDELAAAGVPAGRVVLAALGPRMLRLARERVAGTVPVLVTPEHTRRAREILGAGRLVLPGQQVVLDPDAGRARAAGRASVVTPALHVANYTGNLRRIGFTDADLAGAGSDRLIDALVLHGDAAAIAAGLEAHLAAGADQVRVTPLGGDPVATLRAVAAAVLAGGSRPS
jgi:probable F420-dependent oxidoreductase